MMKTKTVTEAANFIQQVSETWDGKGSIYALCVRAVRRQSKDPVFNLAAWLLFNYGPSCNGETEAAWIKSAKTILKIIK